MRFKTQVNIVQLACLSYLKYLSHVKFDACTTRGTHEDLRDASRIIGRGSYSDRPVGVKGHVLF